MVNTVGFKLVTNRGWNESLIFKRLVNRAVLSSLHLCIQVSGGNSSRDPGLQELASLDKKQGACLALLHKKQAFSLAIHELGAWRAFTVYVTLQPTIAKMQDACEKKNRQLKSKERMLSLPSVLVCFDEGPLTASSLQCRPHTFPPTFSWAHDPHLDRWFMDSLPMASFSCSTRSRGMLRALGTAADKRQLKDSDT